MGNKEPTLIRTEVNKLRQHYRFCYGFAKYDAFTKVLNFSLRLSQSRSSQVNLVWQS